MSGAEDSEKYVVELAPAAVRDLKQLVKQLSPSRFDRIDRKIQALANDPRPPGCEKLSGTENIYRIRDGDYRIIYQVSDRERRVEIARVRDRKDVYRP